MKTKILSFIAIVTLSFAVNAQIDRSKMPKQGPDPIVKLGNAETFTLPNGLKVILVENHKLPRASVNLTLDNKPVFEGEKAGLSNLMGSLLGKGTTTISKNDFNEKVDYLGAHVQFYGSGAYASSLKRYFSEVLSLMADGVKNSQFTREEFDKEVKITLDGLKSSEKSITTIARRVEDALTYGKNHPFGEFTTKETIKNITLADVKNNYNTYYKPNNAYLVIVGDINAKKTKKLVTKLFSNWDQGVIPEINFKKPANVDTTEIDFINMSNAVQSEIAITNNIDLKLGDKDYYAVLLANQILGGDGTARLFMNLRENKGYTYGSYSSIRQSRNAAIFKVTASVRNVVTDSSVVEIQKEINRIRYQRVSAEELKNVKEKYIGNFVMDVQKPATVARFALNIARYNLPEDFYTNYIKNINAVTLDNVQNAAIKYFRGDKARIIITGKGIEVLKNLEKGDYKINYFDVYGKPTEKPAMSLPIPEGTTAITVIDKYIEAIGGKEKVMNVKSVMITATGLVQGISLTLVVKNALQNKSSIEVTGMGQVLQQKKFNGETGYNVNQGKRAEMTATEVEEAKKTTAPFTDLAYKNGTLTRIEFIDGKNAYVITFEDTEIFYDMTSGLKIKSIVTIKKFDEKEVKVPTLYKDYKEVSGIKFPHTIVQKMGPMELEFKTSEIKINEDVSDEDFN